MASASKSTEYGQRLIPDIVDDKARDHPQQEAFQVPRSSDPNDGWRVVTWKEYANAINHVAWRMIELCGRPDERSFPTVAYLGPNDARYVVFFVAAIKAGYKVRLPVRCLPGYSWAGAGRGLITLQALFISPRNSQEGQINLFDNTDCQFLCFPSSHQKVVQSLLEERPGMKGIEVGQFESWVTNNETTPFPYTMTFEEAEGDPVAVLHTSGSTGLPKPIVVRVGMISTGDAFHDLPDWQDTQYIWRKVFTQSKRMWLPSRLPK